jgi:ribosomal protein S18 acetylase RimI-like enzyme
MLFRPADTGDIESIAQLHCDSWLRTYRGMYSDRFLDGDLIGNRRTMWSDRMENPDPRQHVVLAIEGAELAGFVAMYGDEEPGWGSLIDNLHTSYAYRRQGIATELMRRAGEWLMSNYGDLAVFLWVIEANRDARAFYDRIGGTNARVEEHQFDPWAKGNACRYVWRSPDVLAALGPSSSG